MAKVIEFEIQMWSGDKRWNNKFKVNDIKIVKAK